MPFHSTVDPDTNPDPLTVNVNAPLPADAEAGLSEIRDGTGLDDWIVKTNALDVPPPGAGLTTVTTAVPAVATSLAGMSAVSCVDET
ncbi:MAG: hypothetical protein ACRDHZ_01740 [Ktedonobacteraceae bacterium]